MAPLNWLIFCSCLAFAAMGCSGEDDYDTPESSEPPTVESPSPFGDDDSLSLATLRPSESPTPNTPTPTVVPTSSPDAASPVDTPDATSTPVGSEPPDETLTPAPTEIPPDPPMESVDVLVIGGGASGISAAISAQDAGASVLVLEREDELGGAGAYAGHFFGAGTKYQAEFGIEDSAEAALAEWNEFSEGDSSAYWVRQFVEQSGETLEWMLSYGGSVTSIHQSTGAGSVARLHFLDTEEPGYPILSMAAQLSPYTMLSTAATELIFEDGRVIGARFEDLTDGTVGWIQATAVVVATGGFARDIDRLHGVLPQLDNFPVHTEAWPGMTGSGLDMMEAVGAQLSNMENTGLYAHGVTDAWYGSPEVMVLEGTLWSVVVDAAGERAINEEWTYSFKAGHLYLEQGPFYAIVDKKGWDNTYMSGLGYNYTIGSEEQRLLAEEYAAVADVPVAADLLALGEAAGLDGETLVDTVDTYNAGFETGTDEFGKDLTDLSPLETPPYHAIPIVVAGAKSFGGARLSDQAEVLDAEDAPIPGLFAAGEAAGMLGGPHIGLGFSGSITACFYSGRVAGSAAAATASELE